MTRFYQNLPGKQAGLPGPLPKAEALAEAKAWLRGLSGEEARGLPAARRVVEDTDGPGPDAIGPAAGRPYEHPYYWAAFILIGDPR
jgi:CHAT domain-containing protein